MPQVLVYFTVVGSDVLYVSVRSSFQSYVSSVSLLTFFPHTGLLILPVLTFTRVWFCHCFALHS